MNNGGYTIERILCNNPENPFNDIVQMDYTKFVRSFKGDVWATRVETKDDFDKALRVTQMMNKLCYIEVVTDNMDMPELIKMYTGKSGGKLDCKLTKKADSKFGTSVHLSLSEIDGGKN